MIETWTTYVYLSTFTNIDFSSLVRRRPLFWQGYHLTPREQKMNIERDFRHLNPTTASPTWKKFFTTKIHTTILPPETFVPRPFIALASVVGASGPLPQLSTVPDTTTTLRTPYRPEEFLDTYCSFVLVIETILTPFARVVDYWLYMLHNL